MDVSKIANSIQVQFTDLPTINAHRKVIQIYTKTLRFDIYRKFVLSNIEAPLNRDHMILNLYAKCQLPIS